MGDHLHVAVVGAHRPHENFEALAHEVGRLLGQAGVTVINGGGPGVMAAVSRGVKEAGGRAVGILFEGHRDDANEWLELSIPTGMGHFRNALVVRSADVVIAVGGAWGTLSEIALARCFDRPVVLLESWGLERPDGEPLDVLLATTPEEAVQLALGTA